MNESLVDIKLHIIYRIKCGKQQGGDVGGGHFLCREVDRYLTKEGEIGLHPNENVLTQKKKAKWSALCLITSLLGGGPPRVC